jgi:two-component system sensor histidine kinase AdeS
MKRWPDSLRWRMAATAALSTAAASFIVLGGATAYYIILEIILYDSVSPETLRLLRADDAGELLQLPAVSEINAVWETHTVFRLEGVVWISLIAAGIAAGALIGSFWGGRIAKPIEGVARAAEAIIAGDFTARAPTDNRLRGEPARLVRNFNRLAEGLEEAERELAGSASAIAHELRTPVTILRARLQAVRDGIFEFSDHEIEGLIGQADLMAALIEDMRLLSLASVHKLDLQLVRVDIAEEVRSVISTLIPALTEAGMLIESELRPSFACADPTRVRQILNALLDNVRRYAADGGVVRIETRATADDALLLVADRGSGIPKGRDAKLLFDRFWRGEPSRSRDTGGTGLGLAVVKALAEAQGGSVSAYNREGGGAVFEIRLPASASIQSSFVD